MLSYRYTLLYYCRIYMRLYTYVLSLCVIYIIECRPNVRTLDRPKPNVLTLDLALFLCILTPVGSKLDVLTPGSLNQTQLFCVLTSDLLTSRPN